MVFVPSQLRVAHDVLNSQFQCHFICRREEDESRFHVFFSVIDRFGRADSVCVYRYTLAFDPKFLLEQPSTLKHFIEF